MNRLFHLFAFTLLLAACSHEEASFTEPSVPERPASETVSLCFRLSGRIAGTRTPEEEDAIRREEGNVQSLCYAIFKDEIFQKGDYVDLTNRNLQTGSQYLVSNLDKELFCETTEIFAIANASDDLKEALLPTPAPALEGDNTLYGQWKTLTHNENLNTTTSTAASRLVDVPLMAGYLALTDAPGSVITVPVEHIYSRIWFQFGFTGETDAPDITIDQIEVQGLPQQTKVFNTGSTPADNNIEGSQDDAEATVCISCEDTQHQNPFLADLTRTEAPWHLTDADNEGVPMLRFVPASPAYKVVCRYPGREESPAELDTDKCPVRYYLYSYQWGGVATADDPLITVTYHYTATTDDGTEKTVRKRAFARLYDENHDGGKLHHGVLRNYTYRVNCRINTASHSLDIQVIPHDWYQLVVDDIPSFD